MDAKKLNASQLARQVGVSHVAIGNLLKNDMPRSELLFAIARALGVSMDYFFGGSAEPKDWTPGEPLPEEPSMDQVQAFRQHTTIAANALRRAEEAGKLKAVKGRVEALEEQARQLRELIDDMITGGPAPEIRPQPPTRPVRYSEPVNSPPGTDMRAHAHLVGERPAPRPPASRGPAGRAGAPSASVPAPVVPPHPPASQ